MTSKNNLPGTIIGCLLAFVFEANAFGQAQILGGAKERQPSYGEFENFTILSYSDLEGWDQAAEFRVSKDGKHVFFDDECDPQAVR